MSRTNVSVQTETYGWCSRKEYNGTHLVSDQPFYQLQKDRSLFEVRSSNVTPGYRSTTRHKKRRGPKLSPLSFYYVKDERNYLKGSGTEEYGDTVIFWSGAPDNAWAWQQDFTSNLYTAAHKQAFINMARLRVLEKIKDQKVNLMQVFGERRQTADMFVTAAKRATDVVVHLKQGNLYAAAKDLGLSATARQNRKYQVRYAKNPAEAVANGWLELQYGWLPLLSDLYGSAELLAQAHLREVRQRVRYKRRHSQYPTFTVGYDVPETRTVHISREYFDIQIVLDYVATSDEQHLLSQVGITNPAHLAWELLPFSFVADWFIPIGNWLSSWDATAGLQFRSGYQTTFHRIVRTMRQRGQAVHPGGTSHRRDYRGSWEFVECQRSVLTDFPSVTPPSFKDPFSTDHVLNAIALVTQVFSGGNVRKR